MREKRSTVAVGSKLELDLRKYTKAASGSAKAAAAMIAGVLAMPHPAEAHPVYTPANQLLTGRYDYFEIDLNNDGITDVTLLAYDTFSEGSGYFVSYAGLRAYAAQSGNGIAVSNRGFVVPGKRGEEVGSSVPFSTEPYLNSRVGEGGGGHTFHDTSGPWFNLANHFVGVKFLINGEIHYGWLRMSVSGPDYGLLTGYAYETEPNTPITCGFKNYDGVTIAPHPSTKTKPEPQIHKVVPSSLGFLATGAIGRLKQRAEGTTETK